MSAIMKQLSKKLDRTSPYCCRCAKPILLVVVVTLFASTLLAPFIRAIAVVVSLMSERSLSLISWEYVFLGFG